MFLLGRVEKESTKDEVFGRGTVHECNGENTHTKCVYRQGDAEMLRSIHNAVMKKKKPSLGSISVIVTVLVGVFTLLGFTVGGYSFLDQRYALAKSFVVLEKRVSVNELKHLYHSSLDNVYFFRKQARIYPNDEEVGRKLEKAEQEQESIEKRLNELLSN